MFTLTEAAEYLGITRGAVFDAIKKNRILAEINRRVSNPMFKIKKEELDHYMMTKYQRAETAHRNGKKLYKIEEGLVPIPFIAKLLEIEAVDLYNGKNMGYFIPVDKSGGQLVFNVEDLLQYALLRGLALKEKIDEVRDYCLSLKNVPKNCLIKAV